MSYGWVCFFSPTLCSWGLFRLTSVPLAHCCRFDRVSHCTTLVIYHSPPPDGRSWQGQFFVVTNSASVSVLGHISRCTCVRFSREHSRKWNCWVGGCSHLQLYQLPNSSQKWLYQLYFSKIPPFFSFPTHASIYYDRPTSFSSLSHKLPSTPYTHASSYKSSRNSGLARPAWGQGRNWVMHSRDLCVMGVWERVGEILQPAYVNNLRWVRQCLVMVVTARCLRHHRVAKTEELLLPNGSGKGPWTIFQNSFRIKGSHMGKIPACGSSAGPQGPSSTQPHSEAENCYDPFLKHGQQRSWEILPKSLSIIQFPLV